MALKPCRECGNDVSQEAAACPRCGVAHPTRKKTSKGAAVAVVFIVIGVAVVAGSRDPEPEQGAAPTSTSSAAAAPSPRAAPARAAAIEVTARELWTVYDDNEVAADDQYKGKRLLVTGKLKSIDKDFMDDIVLLLHAPGDFDSVHANLDEADESLAAGLRKGAAVTVACTGGGVIMGSPILRDCRLQ